MKQWTTKSIESVKKLIKAELDRNAGLKPKPRADYALRQIRALESENTSESRLKTFVYIISVLVAQQRQRVLPPRYVDNLIDRAYAMLNLQGIRPQVSKFSYLFGEVHQAASMISRREGQFWRSAWEQQIGAYISHPNLIGGEGFQALAFGLRCLRIGHLESAINSFRKAEEIGLKGLSLYQAQIGRAQALRLSWRLEEASDVVEGLLAADAPDFARVELEWEKFCLHATVHNGDISPMLAAVKKGKRHHAPTYVTEAFLWAHAHGSKKCRKELPSIDGFFRRKDGSEGGGKAVLKVCRDLIYCYDTDVPIFLRLKKVGDSLSKSSRLQTMDRELLYWLAVARWLRRVQAAQLAQLVLQEYRNKCFVVSQGKTEDIFGLLREHDEDAYEAA